MPSVARASAQSNPADEPSKGVCDEMFGSRDTRRVDVMQGWVNAASETKGDSAAKD